MIFLDTISIKELPVNRNSFPYNLPLVREFKELKFNAEVTFFVGENGSGKSTLLEALAAATGTAAVGSESIERDTTLQGIGDLAKNLRLSWKERTRRGFFLRAEDFFGFTKTTNKNVKELQEEADKYSGDDYGSKLARGSLLNQKSAMIKRYGENLDHNSHGESFLKLFQSRFVPKGIYFLDEPEVPLSPLRQLAFLSLIKEMVTKHDAQFVIATHSPILMAFPAAEIYNFDKYPLEKIKYEELEHVTLTRDFLNDPSVFLQHL